jgi:hypothetical protein
VRVYISFYVLKIRKGREVRQTSDAIVPAECARSRSSELAKVSLKVAIFLNSLPFLFKYGYSVVKHQK